MKRSRESDINPSAKRCKVEKMSAIKKPFIRTDDDELSVYTNMNCSYVKIGKYVYKRKPIGENCAKEYRINPDTAIGLTFHQFQELKSYLFNKKLSICNFEDSVDTIKSLTIDLTTYDTIPLYMQYERMVNTVRQFFDEHIIYADQQFRMRIDNVDIIMIISDMNNMKYGKITDETEIDFETSNIHIKIYNRCFKLDYQSVKVFINKCVDANNINLYNYYQAGFRFPLIISRSVLTEYIKETYNNRFCHNDKRILRKDGYEFTFTIQVLNTEKNAKYQNIFKLRSDSGLIPVVSNVDNVVVIEENVVAEKIYFRLLPAVGSEYDPSDYIVYYDELEKYIRETISKVVSNQLFRYKHNSKNIVLCVNGVVPYSMVEVSYEIKSVTKIVFNNEKDSNFIVVNNSEPYELRSITFRIDNPSGKFVDFLSLLLNEDDDSKILSSKKLTKAIRSSFPSRTTLEHRVSVLYKNSKFTATVKKMEFVDKNVGKDAKKRYPNLGLITDQTEIRLEVSKENKSLTIDHDDGSSIIKNPIEELKKEVGGLTEQIKVLVRTICLSRGKLRKEFKARGLKSVKGIIIYGPPGTGKTLVARNIGKLLGCTEENGRFRLMNGPEIFDKWVGSSEKNVRKIFAPAKEAWKKYGEKAPTYIVCIDEIDAMLPYRTSSDHDPVRNKVVNQFIGEMDGLEQFNNLIIIGLTNKLEFLDPAVIRSGRFSVHLEFGLPDSKGRLKIFEIYTRKLKELNRLEEGLDLKKLADQTNEFSGADIEEVCNMASTLSLDRVDRMDLDEITDEILNEHGIVTEKDFIQAIKQVKETKRKNDNISSKHLYL